MFKRIVIGIDFLPATEALLAQVADLPGANPEAVALVHVLETRYPQTAEETHRSHYEQRLADMADELAGKLDVPVESVVRSGEAAAELLAEVASRDADLLMIGNPRHGRVHKMLMGSTAAEVTQRADGPIWLQPPEPASCSAAGDGVLLLTDGGEGARHAEEAMLALAEGFDRRLVLTVNGDSGVVEPYLKALGERIEGLETRHEQGGVSEWALGVIEETCPGLVIVGKNRRGAFASLAFGTTAEAVCIWARRPVLLVP